MLLGFAKYRGLGSGIPSSRLLERVYMGPDGPGKYIFHFAYENTHVHDAKFLISKHVLCSLHIGALKIRRIAMSLQLQLREKHYANK